MLQIMGSKARHSTTHTSKGILRDIMELTGSEFPKLNLLEQ